ncbi:GyrI-like domain-containing protein [Paenibacillus sp. CF384]|uniref:GyrI-like domain-containing protein n=1 Tax=Paenibacillus sp. CF384 TaxID=1884382 RepID=UPI000898E040|nr:GyrI-like domain-containing protein [Paenibacillus sp. CF384]SDW58028.1 Predicted transcriptional regulator YdeE, contains AraC-type DNA-binding domain [Paenibacillus sp. CF384]
MNSIDDVQEVSLPERHYVGMAITSVFANHDPKRVEQHLKAFIARRFEIKQLVDAGSYVCHSFVCDQLFTYLSCMEVRALPAVPEGMIGFTIPPQRYVKVRVEQGDPYELLHAYIKAQGLSSNKRGMAMEVYQIHKPLWPSEVDVYIPLL